MKLKSLVTPIDQMSEEELTERLRTIRHSRERARPVARRKAAKAEKKESSKKLSSTEKLFAALSEEDRNELVAKLQEMRDT